MARPEPIWVFGGLGSGVSTMARILADRRQVACFDDAERADASDLSRWLRENPQGVLASHLSPESELVAAYGSQCLVLRLESLEEDPLAIGGCLAGLAEEEGIAASIHPVSRALGALPCPGNLRGLRNRLVRWKLLGQLPETLEDPAPADLGNPEAEDLATHLHELERMLLHRALRRSFGNRVEAARRLGVSRRQLYLLIGRHGDPLRGEIPTQPGPKRFLKRRVKTS
ncbi:MAG: hypothetical protein IPQ13_05330 [Holophagaceae bacterium]|nr:hypothetical protein [Holophagaceae bacterium]